MWGRKKEASPELLEKLDELKKNDDEENDKEMKARREELITEIERTNESLESIQQKESGLKRKIGDVDNMSEKMVNITTTSLERISDHVVGYLGVDEQSFSKQVLDLEAKLKSLKKEIEEIKSEITEKEKEIDNKSKGQGVIDFLIGHNKLVRVYNKMKEEYDIFLKNIEDNISFSSNLQPLFNKELGKIVEIQNLTVNPEELKMPTNETEINTLYTKMEKMKKDDLKIEEKTKEIIDKFNKLKSLINKFNNYAKTEKDLTEISKKIITLKNKEEEFKQKKIYLQEIKVEIALTLNLDELDELDQYEDDLPHVAAFMRELTDLDTETGNFNGQIKEETQKFDEAKSKLDGLKLDFVKAMETDIQNVKYDGNLEDELGTIGDLKDEISEMLNESVKRLIFTSFINGIQKSNLPDYQADVNDKYYLVAYIYTLVYELGNDQWPLDVILNELNIDNEDKQKSNSIGAHTINDIKSLEVDNLQIDNLNEFVFGDFELLESKHVAFLKNYKDKAVINELLMNIFNVIVQGAIDYVDLNDNLPERILPFYKEIIKTEAEREAEVAEKAKIGFTKVEFDYYLQEKPYVDEVDLFEKMKEFLKNYTGVFGEGVNEQYLTELTTQINDQALSQFIKKYNDKKNSVESGLPERPGRDDNYITLEHYKAFLIYLDTKIPLDDTQIPDAIRMYGGPEGSAGSHASVLNEILNNLPDILKLEEADMLYEFNSWFFHKNKVRDQNGKNTFAETTWYQNHIAKLEEFLENIISKRIEYLGNQDHSQGSSQSGTNFRYKLPLIDPTKFGSLEIMYTCRAVAFLKVLLGDDFDSILREGSWDSVKPSKLERSTISRTYKEICDKFKEYIGKRDNIDPEEVSVKREVAKFRPDIRMAGSEELEGGKACEALSDELWLLFKDVLDYCKTVTGGSQKRRKDTRRKRKDTRRKRKDTRRKTRK